MTDRNLVSMLVRDWVQLQEGWFSVKDIYRDLNVESRTAKAVVRQTLHRMKEIGQVEAHAQHSGVYRWVNKRAEVVNWTDADPTNEVPIRLPFDIHDYVVLFPRSIVVVAGFPNCGKTAFLLNLIKLNMDSFQILYFTSEMGPEELKVRLMQFDLPLSQWKFEAYERVGHFADVISPDAINVIDYLEVSDNFTLVAQELTSIWSKLRRGLAVVALQKKRGVELGRGAEFSLEKPRLYVSLEPGKPFSRLTIVKAKNWRQHDINPNGLVWQYKLHRGCEFQIVEYPKELILDDS